jgi:hypothetical protein
MISFSAVQITSVTSKPGKEKGIAFKKKLLMKTYVLSAFLYEPEAQWLSTPSAGEPLALTPCSDAILVHDAFDPVLARVQQGRKLAMTHRIILLVQFFNAHRQLLIHFRTLGMRVQATASNAQRAGQLAFVDRTVGSAQRARQFHLLRRA